MSNELINSQALLVDAVGELSAQVIESSTEVIESSTEVIEPMQLLGKVVGIERRGGISRLDTRAGRWRNRAAVCVSHVVPRLLPLALRLRRGLRAALHG